MVVGATDKTAVRFVSHVEGWISPDWTDAGITLKGRGSEEWEVIRLKNEGPFVHFLLMYDGIDLMMDTGWLDRVVPRVADVFGVAWRIVDYTVTPPKIDRQSESAAAGRERQMSGVTLNAVSLTRARGAPARSRRLPDYEATRPVAFTSRAASAAPRLR
jgi:hypothetical protein